MEVLLVNPSWEGFVTKKARLYNWSFPPLDLLNISSILKLRGLHTKVLDLRVRPHSVDQLISEFDSAEKIILTTSPLDRWQCPNIDLDKIFELIRLIKDKEKLLITGVHGTIFPEYILKQTDADLVVRGEPEKTISELFDNKNIEEIKGISYIKDGRLVSNPDQELIDVNKLPIPDYEAVEINDYRYEFLGNRFALLQFSRGCPYDCIFCLKKMYGEGYRKKDPKKFMEEIDYILNVVRAKSIYFYDLTFTTHKASIYNICEFIQQRGYKFKWCCQTRFELIDSDLLSVMKSAGCELMHFGVESGSHRISNLLEKSINLEKIREGVRTTKKAGISTVCFFMFGFPSETIQDINRTVEFSLEINPDYASYHIAIPYAGTKFYEMAGEEEKYPEMYTKEIPARILKRVLRKAFIRFYLRPRYIFREIMMRPNKLFSKINLFFNFIR